MKKDTNPSKHTPQPTELIKHIYGENGSLRATIAASINDGKVHLGLSQPLHGDTPNKKLGREIALGKARTRRARQINRRGTKTPSQWYFPSDIEEDVVNFVSLLGKLRRFEGTVLPKEEDLAFYEPRAEIDELTPEDYSTHIIQKLSNLLLSASVSNKELAEELSLA